MHKPEVLILLETKVHSCSVMDFLAHTGYTDMFVVEAYDRIDWGYLENILHKVGFGSMLIKVILSCLESSHLVVLWNGEQMASFKPGRGLRQGDPLLPYLFVLCMEVLGQWIQHTVETNQWRASKIKRGSPIVSHLFFADNLLLFSEASCRQSRQMHQILKDFCGESGQRVNSKKSKVWYTPNTPAGKIQAISKEFGIPYTKQLRKYLGVPLIHERVQSRHFDYLIEKVHMRLSGWKSKLLLQAARLVLIQSVTSTIPSYVMQSCKLPMKTIQLLERANRRFFWGDTDQKLTMHSIAWPTVCQPKQHGGLGLRRMDLVNKVMLAKLAWRYLKEPHAWWTQVLSVVTSRLGAEAHTSNLVAKSFTCKGFLYGYAVLAQGL